MAKVDNLDIPSNIIPVIKAEQENDECPEHLWYQFSWASTEKKALKKFFGKRRLTKMVEDHNLKVLYINFESENQLDFNLDSLVSTLASTINPITLLCLYIQLIWDFNQVLIENVKCRVDGKEAFVQPMGLNDFSVLFSFLLSFIWACTPFGH